MLKFRLFVLLAAISVCAHAESGLKTKVSSAPIETSPALDLNAFSTVQQIIPALAERRVVFIGEQHTRYDHHLTQLEIIRRLHALHPQLAIGMEMFQQPFQRHLDEYIAGSISEQGMLRATEYYQRWRMDYRYYAPILRYAREHLLPLVALNVPTELTRKVGRVGLEGLSEDERQQLPADIEAADESYRQRIKVGIQSPPEWQRASNSSTFSTPSCRGTKAWPTRAAYLRETPGPSTWLSLPATSTSPGATAIPKRLQRRLESPAVSILNSWDGANRTGPGGLPADACRTPVATAGKDGCIAGRWRQTGHHFLLRSRQRLRDSRHQSRGSYHRHRRQRHQQHG